MPESTLAIIGEKTCGENAETKAFFHRLGNLRNIIYLQLISQKCWICEKRNEVIIHWEVDNKIPVEREIWQMKISLGGGLIKTATVTSSTRPFGLKILESQWTVAKFIAT